MMRVPSELLQYKQWVLWRRAEANGRATKIPISPWSGKPAACDRPQTWSTYKHVRFALRRFPCDGIGFVFTDADPFCGVDLDQCQTINGAIAPGALVVIKRFASYTELSPSGTGAHVLIKGKLSGSGRRKGKVEMYDSGRYFSRSRESGPYTKMSHQNCARCTCRDRRAAWTEILSLLGGVTETLTQYKTAAIAVNPRENRPLLWRHSPCSGSERIRAGSAYSPLGHLRSGQRPKHTWGVPVIHRRSRYLRSRNGNVAEADRRQGRFWSCCLQQDQHTVFDFLAYCVARTVNGVSPNRMPH